jgi:hypothetical protein
MATVDIDDHESLTKGDLVQASKAIYDQMKSLMDDRLHQLETDTSTRVGRSVDKLISDRVTASVKSLVDDVERRMEALAKTYKDSLAELIAAIKAMPAPEVTVNVPEQKAPQVNVNVPTQKAPEVNVHVPKQDAPKVTVNVPQQAAPKVEVKVPEQKAPTVNVEAPTVNVEVPRRKVTKHITYDAHGRPAEIIEEEAKD